jgi:carbamoyltransferase
MIVLGLNAYHGDVAAAVLRDGELVAAVEEERFNRIKHVAGFPQQAVQVCLEMAGISARDVDWFAVSRDPRANLLRKAAFALRYRPSAAAIRDRLRNRRAVQDVAGALAEATGLDREHVRARLQRVEHHPAHLASAFFASPFDEAAVCAIDGFGDFVSTSWALGRGSSLGAIDRVYFPHSLGLLYLAITQFLGFHHYGDEFKVMGLAPYGEPDYVKPIRRLVHLRPGGRFELDLRYFRHASDGVPMTWDAGEPHIGTVYTAALESLLGPARRRDESIDARHEAIAASVQRVFEEAFFHVLAGVHRQFNVARLCLAGGCAMNSVANGKIRSQTPFEDVFIQPAAGDNGTALGAALYVWNHVLSQPRRLVMRHSYWGPASADSEVRAALDSAADRLRAVGCEPRALDEATLCDWTAERIAQGRVVGWYQGRMEWAARALGNRSIVADPRRADMRDIINTKIKFREKFRPFAPSVLEEALDEYFVDAVPDPFMIQVYPVREDKRRCIPAVTHVDGSGRVQTVSRETNARFWRLINAFRDRTGIPILLNTSFNENEPIVHRPEQALDCFLRTGMDVLVIEQYVLEKRTQ